MVFNHFKIKPEESFAVWTGPLMSNVEYPLMGSISGIVDIRVGPVAVCQQEYKQSSANGSGWLGVGVDRRSLPVRYFF